MFKRLTLTLAMVLFAGVLLFPFTVHAEEIETAPAAGEEFTGFDAETGESIETEADITGDSEESESGIPPYDGPMYLSPDGTGTVSDNVFIEGNGLEFFTFTTEDGNVFYLVIDRLRTKDNVYFLNAVTEEDLMSLAEKKDSGGTSASTSGIPSTSGGTQKEDPAGDQEPDEQPPEKKGNNGMLIFLLIGVAVVGGVAYYFKIIRPKQRPRDDDDADDFDDADDSGDDDYSEYSHEDGDFADTAEKE